MRWLQPRPEGLYCAPGDFWIDPSRAVPRAVITHAHGDHARPGHGAVLATAETLAFMRIRLGEGFSPQPAAYGEVVAIGDARVSLRPAGHILGSAQVVIEHAGRRAVISGDYKTVRDPTCAPFEPVPCDLFVTEATFGLPVFRHPDPAEEIAKLLANQSMFPDSTHVVGCYPLGKCQRLIMLLREAGYDAPIHLHGALQELCTAYAGFGVKLGALRPATATGVALKGAIVLAPPSAIRDRWARRLHDPVAALASGWMRVRQRAKAQGAELPLVISDHADWDELLATLDAVAAPEIWVTHGREEALIHAASLRGIRARALSLLGREEDAGE